MKQTSTLFSYICFREAECPENWATDALNYILQNSQSAARALGELVSECGMDVPQLTSFHFQRGKENVGRPDLRCEDERGSSCVILESKFDAPLTKHQPSGYITLSNQYNVGLVLFVVPEARKYSVWKKVLERCETNASAKSQGNSAMLWAELCSNHYIGITTWSTVLCRLEKACGDDQERRDDIKQLQGLTDAMDIAVFSPLSEMDTSKDIARRFNNYLDLPRDILAEADRQKLCKTKRITKESQGLNFHAKDGLTAAFAGQYAEFGPVEIWVGLDTRLWALHGASPIWCILERDIDVALARKALRTWLERTPRLAYEDNNNKWISIPIFLAVNVDKGDVVQDTVKQLRRLHSKLNQSVKS